MIVGAICDHGLHALYQRLATTMHESRYSGRPGMPLKPSYPVERRKHRRRSLLPSAMPTINPQIAPRHKATRITYQEHRRTSILLRHTQLAQHILRRPIPLALRVLVEQRFYHRGDDVAGGDGVDADAVGSPLGGEIATELEHCGFGGVVGGTDESLKCVVSMGEVDGDDRGGSGWDGLRGWRLCRSWRRS